MIHEVAKEHTRRWRSLRAQIQNFIYFHSLKELLFSRSKSTMYGEHILILAECHGLLHPKEATGNIFHLKKIKANTKR